MTLTVTIDTVTMAFALMVFGGVVGALYDVSGVRPDVPRDMFIFFADIGWLWTKIVGLTAFGSGLVFIGYTFATWLLEAAR